MRQALVLANKVVAGTLTETDDMRYVFKYDDAYLINPQLRAISLAFPKRKEEYVSEELFPFFYNMLSEGIVTVSGAGKRTKALCSVGSLPSTGWIPPYQPSKRFSRMALTYSLITLKLTLE